MPNRGRFKFASFEKRNSSKVEKIAIRIGNQVQVCGRFLCVYDLYVLESKSKAVAY